MQVVKRDSELWEYLAEEIRGLLSDGETLCSFVQEHSQSSQITDFSFMVFPFAKAYEGFLKKLFMDAGLIKPDEYYSDDIRIGRILNPGFQHETQNVFAQLGRMHDRSLDVSQILWDIWKKGRNSVFHYFPHNFRRLSQDDALDLVNDFVKAMEVGVSAYKAKINSHKEHVQAQTDLPQTASPAHKASVDSIL